MSKKEFTGAPKFEETEEIKTSSVPSFDETSPVEETASVKKKVEPIPSSSPSEDGISKSTIGTSVPSSLPAINEGINPPGVFEQKPQSQQLETIVTSDLPTQGMSVPSYQTAGDVSAGGDINAIEKGGGAIFGSDISKSILSTSASLGAGLARSPQFLADQTNKALNFINPVPQITGKLPTNTQELKNPIANSLQGASETLHKEANVDYLDKEGNELGVSDYLDPTSDKWDLSKGLGKLVNNVSEMMPIAVAYASGGAAGLSTGTMAGLGTSVFAANEKQSLLEKNKEAIERNKNLPASQQVPVMTDDQMNNVAILSGAIDGVGDALFGNVKFGKMYKALFAKSGEDAAKEAVKQSVKDVLKKATGQYAKVVTEESLSEGTQTLLDNLNHIYIGGDKSINPMDNVMESIITAAGSAGFGGLPTLGLSVARHKADVQKAQQIKEQQDNLKKELSNPLITPETKKVIVDKLHDLNTEEDAHVKEMTDKHNKLPDNKKTEVDDILKKNSELASAALDPSISPEGKEALQAQIEKGDKEVESIYKENEKLLKEQEKETAKQTEANKKNGITEEFNPESYKEFEEKAKADFEQSIIKEQKKTGVEPVKETPTITDEFDEANNKKGIARKEAFEKLKEKYPKEADKAKLINDNFDTIVMQMKETKKLIEEC